MSANASAYPSRKSSLPIGIVNSRDSVPVERSRRVATDVTTNMMIDGNTASSGPPIRSKTIGESLNIHHIRLTSSAGSTISIATVRWSRRSCASTRAATANVTRAVIVHQPSVRSA
jgi:hypothetical protein